MFRRSFLFHLLIIIGICFAMYFTFFGSLALITNHGKEIAVPNIVDRDVRVAVEELEQAGYEVIVDSTYNENLKPYSVVSQLPEVGQLVKKGRTIFLTVNKSVPPMVSMPNLNGLSFRSALMVLKSNKLLLGDTVSRPDIAIGAVLEQTWKGTVILAGTMIPMGTTIDLVLGNGLSGEEFNVPDVIGMKLVDAIAMLQANNLQYTLLADGVITDSNSAIVYIQIPNGLNELNLPNRIKEGDFVDLRYKQLPTEGELDSNRNPFKYVEHQNFNDDPEVLKAKQDADQLKAEEELKKIRNEESIQKSGSKPTTNPSKTNREPNTNKR